MNKENAELAQSSSKIDIIEVVVNYGKRTELYECESKIEVIELIVDLMGKDEVCGFEVIK